MEQPIRIILADDHAIMRDGLRKILSGTTGMHIVAEASEGSTAIQLVSEIGCDVLLLDVSMPDMSGITVLRKLSHAGCLPNTLMLSMHRQPQFMDEALSAGARGYLTKDVDADYLHYVIRQVAKGYPVGAPLKQNDSYLPVTTQHLSVREKQILELLAAGHSVGQVAEIIFVSPKTVSAHKTHIMEKLNVQSDADLYRLVALLWHPH